MATKTWIGAAGGLYSTTTNWSPTGVPVAADDIVFTGDATPNVGATANTVRNVTINAGTVTFSGTGAFTIQGDISNSGTLNMNTFTTNFTGGNNQTLSLGTNSFSSCTINKTIGTRVTLNAAWNITGTASATLTITAGDLYTQGYTVTCQNFSSSGNTDRTIDLGSGAIYCTGSIGTIWNTSHTTATGNAWTKFARNGTAYIQAGANLAVTGGGIAANSLAGARLFGVPPTMQFENNRYYTTTGHFENLILNANFLGVSTPYIWGDLSGTPLEYDQRKTGFTVNPVIVGTSGNTNSITYRAQFASYTASNPLGQNPTFEFTYARATTFTLSANLATYTCYIDSNDTTGAAWGAVNYTVVQSGNASTYNNTVLKSANVLTYTASGPGSTYTFSDTSDLFATSTYTLTGNATSAFNLNSFASLGDITLTFGSLNFNTAATFRNFSSTNSNQRKINFNSYVPVLSGVPTISTGTNLTIENPGGFDKTGTGTVNLSGLNAGADNVFDYYWNSNVTFTTGSAIRNLYLYSGGRLSTTAATTVNLRGGFSSPDASGGTGPFTGLTIQYPNVPNPGALSQSYNAITTSVIPTVTAIGNVTIGDIRATTINLNPNTGATINLNTTNGSANTIACLGFANAIVNINNISLSPNTISFLGNSTYNLSYISAGTSNTSITCGTSASNILAKYNINALDLTGNATVQQLLFDGAGNLVLNSDIDIGRFTSTNSTMPRTITFGPYFMRFEPYGVLNYSGATATIITKSPKNWTNSPGGILINGTGVSLTATTINANSALNLKWAGEYPATFTAGSVNWRNLQNGPDLYYDGIGSFGWFTTSNFTANLYGDLRLGTNNSNSTYWKNVTFTALGDEPYQILNYQTFYAGGYANALILNSNSTVIFGSGPDYGFATHHGTIHFRDVNIIKGNIYVSKNVTLVSEQIRVGNTNPVNFYVDGVISAYRWLCPDTSRMNWIGDGYLTTNGTGVPWGGTYYEADDSIYPGKILSSGDLVSSNTGPKIYIDSSNHSSLIRHANTVVKNLYYNNGPYDYVGNVKFNLNRYITYASGNMPSTTTQNYGLILNSGASSGPYGSANSEPNGYNLYSTDADFASVLFWLPQTGTIYFELTTVNTGSSTLTLGIQSIPRRLGPNVLGYGSGTTITGNNPVYNITTTAYQTAGGPRYVIIDCDAKTVRWNSATVTSWPTGLGTNTAFLGFYDNSQTGRFDVNINWGKNSSGGNTWTLPTASGYLPYINKSVDSLDIFNTGPNITLYSTSTMTSTNPWPSFDNYNIIDMDFEPRSANLYFKDIKLNNSNSSLESSSKNFSANVLDVNNSIELGNSIVTIYGANSIVYTANSNLSNTDKSNNYITHFREYEYPYDDAYLYITGGNSGNINLSNTSFTIECWIRPNETVNQTEYYYAPLENGLYSLNPQHRALLVGRSDYVSRDWELIIRPITRDIAFVQGSNVYASNVSVSPYKWNHVAAVYDLANISIYLNGNRVLTTPMTNVIYTNNRQVSIGYNYFGYMSGLRIVKDSALYSGNTISIPTGKLTNTGNTLLLMLQENNNNNQSSYSITITPAGYLTTSSTNYRFLGYPYTAPNNSEIILTGTGDKDVVIMDSNVNIITNNSRFTHSGNGEGTGWVNFVHGEDKNINIIRTGGGNYNKGYESFQTPINIVPPTITN